MPDFYSANYIISAVIVTVNIFAIGFTLGMVVQHYRTRKP